MSKVFIYAHGFSTWSLEIFFSSATKEEAHQPPRKEMVGRVSAPKGDEKIFFWKEGFLYLEFCRIVRDVLPFLNSA
jgi:hypothetical protein